MKKFFKWSALIAVMSVLFAGCPEDNSKETNNPAAGPGPGPGPGGDTTLVQSISILVDGYKENPPYSMFVGETVDLSAQVLPGTAADKGYSFELVDNDGVLELSEDNELTALKDGTATIKVTSSGKKADGNSATDTLLVSVMDDPSNIEAKLFVHNQNDTTDAATTTVLPDLNADKRYVIVNNESNATVPGAWRDVLGNTIVYLNKPIKISEGETAGTYNPFSISARVRITGGRTTAEPNSTGNCLITGIFTKPTTDVTADTPLYFVGMRHAWNGTKRMYASRSGDNSSTAFGTFAPDFENADSATGKKTGFQEQEYVIKVERTDASVYTIYAYKADGVTLIGSATRGSGTGDQVNTKLQSDKDYYYLGFIVSGVTVEISNIVIKDGTETVFEAATDAAPYPVPVINVNITATNAVGAGSDYDYQCTKADFPSTGVQLRAEVIPSDANQNVTWSISEEGAGATITTGGLVKATEAGEFIVKAESGTAYAEFKFNIFEGIPAVETIEVKQLIKTIMAGNGTIPGTSITLSAEVTPAPASDTANISWSVTGSDGSSATSAATIDADGVLKASDTAISADTTVKVFASSNKGQGGTTVKSAAFEVTVKKYTPNKTWNFSDPIWPWYAFTAQNYTSYAGGGSNDGLTFVGTNGWGPQEAPGAINKYSCGDMTFSHRIGSNGNGSAGTSANRLLKFNVTGPCEIQLYMQSGGSGRMINVVALNSDNTLDTSVGTNGTISSTDASTVNPWPLRVTYTGGAATIGIYNSQNNNFYCIKVVYPME